MKQALARQSDHHEQRKPGTKGGGGSSNNMNMMIGTTYSNILHQMHQRCSSSSVLDTITKLSSVCNTLLLVLSLCLLAKKNSVVKEILQAAEKTGKRPAAHHGYCLVAKGALDSLYNLLDVWEGEAHVLTLAENTSVWFKHLQHLHKRKNKTKRKFCQFENEREMTTFHRRLPQG